MLVWFGLTKALKKFLVKNDAESLSDAVGFIYHVFTPNLWTALFVTLCGFFLGLIVLSRTSDMDGRTGLLNTLSAFSTADKPLSRLHFASNFAKKFVFTRELSHFVKILPLYQNGLLTHLLLPRITQPFGSVDKLVNLIAEGKYKLVFPDRGSGFFQDMNTRSGKMLQHL